MGIAIFSLIALIVSILIIIACLAFMDEYGDNFNLFCSIGGMLFGIIGIVSILHLVGFALIVSLNYIGKDLDLQKLKNSRSSIVRMLQEDYNTTNLTNAIDFNNKQKMIVLENSTFLFKYTTSYYYTDTIQIPENKFMPTSKMILDVVQTDKQ